MTSRTRAGRTRFVLFAAAAAMAAGGLRADVDLEQKATWTVLSAAQAKAQLDAFLQTRTVDEPTAAQIAALWPTEPGPAESAERLLDQVAATLALVDENAKRLVDFCSTADGHVRAAGLSRFCGTPSSRPFCAATCGCSTAAGWHNTSAMTKPSNS